MVEQNQTPLEISVTGIAFGTLLCFYSILKHISRPIKLNVVGNHPVYDIVKNILMIPDDKIMIERHDADQSKIFTPGDHIKFFSPYITPDSIKLFGKVFPINTHRRPCVVFGIHSQSLATLSNPLTNVFPETRQYPISVYSHLFQQFSEAGYDVISLNNETIPLEQKIFILNETCDCVITYEGGLAHLAHVLQIPCIVLPWRLGSNGEMAALNVAERYNLDRKTYFPGSVDEILSWSKQEILTHIENLYQGKGNNVLLEPDITIDKETLDVYRHGMGYTFRPWLDNDNINFIKDNLTEFVVGG